MKEVGMEFSEMNKIIREFPGQRNFVIEKSEEIKNPKEILMNKLMKEEVISRLPTVSFIINDMNVTEVSSSISFKPWLEVTYCRYPKQTNCKYDSKSLHEMNTRRGVDQQGDLREAGHQGVAQDVVDRQEAVVHSIERLSIC